MIIVLDYFVISLSRTSLLQGHPEEDVRKNPEIDISKFVYSSLNMSIIPPLVLTTLSHVIVLRTFLFGDNWTSS
jgi:hypothetical protein